MRRLSGTKAMPARRAAAVLRKLHRLAVDRQRAARRPELAEQRARQLELAAAHEAVDAEHLAGADLERDVAIGAAERQPVDLEHDRRVGLGCASAISPV